MEYTAALIEQYLQNARNWKTQNSLYTIIGRNERFTGGDQWKGINAKNLDKNTYDFLSQSKNTQVSTVMAQAITINRSADELSEDNETVVNAAKAFTKSDKLNWERLKMDAMNENLLNDAYIAGLGASFWYWDKDIKTGNDFVTVGDINGELIDSVELYVSNPNEIRIQKQDWILISKRKSVKQIKEIAKKNGVPENEIEMIKADETTTYEAYDKAQDEQDGVDQSGTLADFYIFLYKKNGIVHFIKSTKEIIIQKETSTKMKLFPVAMMNWEVRKKFIFGKSPLTQIIPNQISANQLGAIRTLHAKLQGIPKVGINTNMIKGFSNVVGGVVRVNAPPNVNISNALTFWQPTSTTIDFDKAISDNINLTKDLTGLNQNVTGESNPENFRAIVAQQKASGVPLESVKRRFYQYIEDVALIWEEMYKVYYNTIRKVIVEENEEKQEIEFTGTELSDVFLKTKIDVGASTQWSELLQIDTIMDLWDRGIIKDPLDIIMRLPAHLIPDVQKLIEKMGGGEDNMRREAMFELMAMFLENQPPDVQQQIQQLPEGEKEQAVIELVMRGAA